MEPTPTPSAPKTRSTLDTAANIAIIVVCIVAVFYLSLQIRDRFAARPGAAGPQMPEIKAGETYDVLARVVPAGADRAMVVAVAPTCHFCEESMPFYKRLVDERNQKGSKTRVVAAVSHENAKADEQKNMANAGVQPDDVVVLDFEKVKLRGTPTILLVDNQGKILNVWVGKQPSGGEEEILAKL